MRGMLLALLFLGVLGCDPGPQPDLKDALIRQQLTGLLAELPSYPSRSVFRAEREVGALLEVEGARLSSTQHEILIEAHMQLLRVTPNVGRFLEDPQGDGPRGRADDYDRGRIAPDYRRPTYEGHQWAYEKARRLIAKAAGTF